MNQAIRAVRIKQGLTQSQVAIQVGITVISYQRIEYGTQRPSLETAIKIAKALNTTVEDLWNYKKEDTL